MARHRVRATGLEYRPSTQPRLDGPGPAAHDYGAEGPAFNLSARNTRWPLERGTPEAAVLCTATREFLSMDRNSYSAFGVLWIHTTSLTSFIIAGDGLLADGE